MGAKRASRKRQNSVNNVVEFDKFKSKNQVQILPRNKNQETYMLKLLDRYTFLLSKAMRLRG